MWLLDTQTLKLQEIVDPSTANYAILSHTWEHDEVSFQDISDLDSARKKAGFSKISNTCELARQRSIPYAWVDTCCIDKSSSAELSEAINSMFQWYKLSVVCFVYLSDFTFDIPFSSFTAYTAEEKALSSSRWFTRGWTLQGLIAPSSIIFYNAQWKALATKTELAEKLERITSIPQAVLESRQLLRTVPVAAKMSWAAHRKTKRIEDRSYSLLGIFDINMPMLYGEGARAFRRLQEEIARETDDLSLFAWQAKERSPDGSLMPSLKQEFRGILSRSPEEFVGGPKLRRNANDEEDVCDFSLANKGVRIDTTFRKGKNGIYVMNLGLSDSETGADVCISLVRTADGFVRSHPWSLFCNIDDAFPKKQAFTAYVRKDVDVDEESWIKRRLHRSFHINITLPPSLEVDFINPHPRQYWDDFFSTFLRPNPSESFGASIDIGIKRVDGGPDVGYPMRITLAWSKSSNRVHAVIHSTEHPIEDESQGKKIKIPGRRMVLGRLRDEIPSFKEDDSFGKPTTSKENRVKAMSENTRSQSKKLYFVEESNKQLQGSEAKFARVTTLELSLETFSDFLFTEYYILVTGQVRVVDLATVFRTDQVRNLLALGVKDWDLYLLDLHYHCDFFGESGFEVSAVRSPSSPAAEGLSAECPLTTP
ncbi:Vegetative incompatibility protein HET-E-1 [Colletotrichum siamense]|uniref:Vegetative incompatibility protein HET-E-1 n=1 Tax=Colletotrichum siamense TaxID=690259 RepID=UPI001872A887|nr:Vegetative incompatibility protein HET-E-1 [Colletotrichum siamense]KAF5501614.1 Vegetative incompatibility protein HET-E-1 [Colletotrichum siamense]